MIEDLDQESTKTVKATETTLEILDALRRLDGAGITELSAHVDCSKSAIHHHLQTLRERRYVLKEGTTYHLGLRFMGLGGRARTRTDIYRFGKNTIDDLARSVCPRLPIDAVIEAHASDEGRIFAGIPATIEVECGYQGSQQAADNAVTLTRAFLRALGVLPEEDSDSPAGVPVYRLGDPIPKAMGEVHEVYADNFQEVSAGEAFAATDGDPLVAEESFHPVLLSPDGYEDVFGYTADRVGSL